MSAKGNRWKAKQAGEKYYLADKPYKLGHPLEPILTSSGGCRECARIADRKRYYANQYLGA